MAEKKEKKEYTHVRLLLTTEFYEGVQSVALRKKITVNQAYDMAGKLLIAEFDKEIAEGLK